MPPVRLRLTIACLFGLLVSPAYAEGELARYHLNVDQACGNAEIASRLQNQIQLRLPSATLVEANVEGAWNISWSPSDEGCQLNVERGESTMSMPLAATQEDFHSSLENAASQIAWIVEMVQPDSALPLDGVEDAGPEAVVAEAAVIAEDAAGADAEPTVVAEDAVVAEAAVVAEEAPVVVAVDEKSVQPDATSVGFAFSIIRDADAEVARIVPSFAINIFGLYHGLSGVEVGLFNSELSFMNGAQLGVGINEVLGDVRGLQIAGIVNFARDVRAGTQFAFGVNSATSTMSGAQISLGMNHAGGLMTGGQVAFGLNIAQSVSGGQLSLLNFGGDIAGFQVGFLNIADDVRGVQIGVINHADKGAVQVGVLNISDTADVAVGLVSIMLDEPVYVTSWTTSQGLILVGVQHGSKYLKTMLFAGANIPGTDEEHVGVAGLGLSGHIPLFDRNYLEVDYLGMQLVGDNVARQSYLSTLRAVWGYAFGERFAVFAGPALSMLLSTQTDGLNIPPSWVTASQPSMQTNMWVWPELHGGVRF